MRPKGMSKEELEARRRAAVRLVEQGFTYREAADAVGAVPSSVSDWMKRYRAQGSSGLEAKPEPPRTESALGDPERRQLARWLRQGARRHGFDTDLWTLSRIQTVIEEQFGLQFHVAHVHRIVRSLGFSSQKPERRAREQDPDAVDAFRTQRWEKLKKGRRTRGGRSW